MNEASARSLRQGLWFFGGIGILTLSIVAIVLMAIVPAEQLAGFEKPQLYAFFLGWVIVGAPMAFLSFVIFRFWITNQLEEIESGKNDLVASMDRKRAIQQQVVDIAQRVSTEEAYIHRGVVEELAKATSGIGAGSSLSVVLAHLAAQFPTLQNATGFQTAQKNAVEIEDKVDADQRALNQKIKDFNATVSVFPSNILARWLRLEKKAYSNDRFETSPAD